ncbi:MAG: hypothetical protein LKK49_04170 [Leuconostoc mesenteroides]|jgi:hypothetical protein|nr:hypothetical protein [Leuconostoc mesenteroides]MCI2167245.1 hypothetical protein [Leuconostoc mesenteroides]
MTLKEKKKAASGLGWLNALLTPLVFMVMWNWFFVKIGAPQINYWLSFGIVLTADFIIMMPSQLNEKALNSDVEYRYKSNILNTSSIIMTMIVAVIIHLFVG